MGSGQAEDAEQGLGRAVPDAAPHQVAEAQTRMVTIEEGLSQVMRSSRSEIDQEMAELEEGLHAAAASSIGHLA